MELKLNAGTPTHSWWKAKVDVALMILGDEDPMRDEFRRKWMDISGRLTSYLSEFLLLVDYPAKLFSCCENPEIVSCDGRLCVGSSKQIGIVLSVESRRILEAKLTTPWKANSRVSRATSRSSRAVLPISKKEDRKRLHDLSHEGIGANDYELLDQAISLASPSIAALIRVSSILEEDVYHCHPALVSFFRSCAKYIFPAIHLMPKRIWDYMDSFDTTHVLSSTAKDAIALHSPMLTGLFAYLGYVTDPQAAEIVLCLIS